MVIPKIGELYRLGPKFLLVTYASSTDVAGIAYDVEAKCKYPLVLARAAAEQAEEVQGHDLRMAQALYRRQS